MTERNIDSQSINFDRRSAIVSTTALAATTLFPGKDVKASITDPTIEAYIEWRRADDEAFKATCIFENMKRNRYSQFFEKISISFHIV